MTGPFDLTTGQKLQADCISRESEAALPRKPLLEERSTLAPSFGFSDKTDQTSIQMRILSK
jgi:hypothetical protein